MADEMQSKDKISIESSWLQREAIHEYFKTKVDQKPTEEIKLKKLKPS